MLRNKMNIKNLTKSISLVLALTMMMPLISWSFDKSLFEVELNVDIKLGGPGSQALANRYYIPSSVGQLSEAVYQEKGKTFVLIQDLHCNYEVQQNIRRILKRLTRTQQGLKLVAVEGASGIIPTLDLGLIKDTPAKRAVADYFVGQGKLTGADHFAICDDLSIELYGAEQANLYDDSLALIKEFSTEQNRGTLFELLDQVQLAKAPIFQPALADFDDHRLAYFDGQLTTEAYQGYLIDLAKKHQLLTKPGALANRLSLNYYEKQIQQQYLEQLLLQKLMTTKEEQELVVHQLYLETIDRIINIAASPQDLINYHKLHAKDNLVAINNYLKSILGNQFLDLKDDLKSITKAVEQGLDFYQLAEKRNHAIYNNTLARVNDRHEQVAVMITGGFHTDAISELAKKQGHSVVTIRPNFSGEDENNNYYDLLLHPEKQSEFETLIAKNYKLPSAIPPRVSITTPWKDIAGSIFATTQTLFSNPVGKLYRVGKLSMTRISEHRAYFRSGKKEFILDIGSAPAVRTKQELENTESTTSFWTRLLNSRIFRLAAVTSAGITSAFADDGTRETASTLSIIPLWDWVVIGLALLAVVYMIWQFTRTRSGILKGALLAGMLFSMSPGIFISAYVTSIRNFFYGFKKAINWQAPYDWLINLISPILNLIGNRFNIARPENPKIIDIDNLIKQPQVKFARSIVSHSIFSLVNPALTATSVAFRGGKVVKQADLEAKLVKKLREDQQLQNNGEEVDPTWTSDTHITYIRPADYDRMKAVLRKVGLDKVADVVQAEYYKEPPEGYAVGLDIGPVAASFLSAYPLVLFNGIKDSLSQELFDFIDRSHKASQKIKEADPETDRVFAETLLFRHPKKRKNYSSGYVNNLLPGKLKSSLDRMFGEGFFDSLFAELVAEDQRKQVKDYLESIIKATDNEELKIGEIDAVAKLVAVHGIIHEIVHGLILHLPLEQEDEFFSLLQSTSAHRIAFKNWIKALKGVKKYRDDHKKDEIEYKDPSVDTQDMVLEAFMTEMACDLFAIYLMEKGGNGEVHVYQDVFGAQLSPELRTFFDGFLKLLVHFASENRILVINKKQHENSRMVLAQGHTAASTVAFKAADNQWGWSAFTTQVYTNMRSPGLSNPYELINTSSMVLEPANVVTDLPTEGNVSGDLRNETVESPSTSSAIIPVPTLNLRSSNKVSGSKIHNKRRVNNSNVGPVRETPTIAASTVGIVAEEDSVVTSIPAASLGNALVTDLNSSVIAPTSLNNFGYTPQESRINNSDQINGQFGNIGNPSRTLETTQGLADHPTSVLEPDTNFNLQVVPDSFNAANLTRLTETSPIGTEPAATVAADTYIGNLPTVADQFFSNPNATFTAIGPEIIAMTTVAAINLSNALPDNQTITISPTDPSASNAINDTFTSMGNASGKGDSGDTFKLIVDSTGTLNVASETSPVFADINTGRTETKTGKSGDVVLQSSTSDATRNPDDDSATTESTVIADTRTKTGDTTTGELSDTVTIKLDSEAPTVSTSTGPAVIVDTTSPADPRAYTMVRVNTNGEMSIGEQLSGIPASEVNKFRSSDAGQALRKVSDILKAKLTNANELSEFVLINPASLTGAQQALLQNIEPQTVTGYRALNAKEKKQLPVVALQQALAPAFKADVTSIDLRINQQLLEQARLVMNAAGNVVLVATTEPVLPNIELGFSLSQAVLRAMTKQATKAPLARRQNEREKELTAQLKSQMESNPFLLKEIIEYVGLLFDLLAQGVKTVTLDVPLEALTEKIDLEIDMGESSQIAVMRSRLSEVLGQPVANGFTDEQVVAMLDELSVLSSVTLVMPIEMALQNIKRVHGKSWESQDSLWQASKPYEFLIPGRKAPAVPELNINEMQQAVSTEVQAQAKNSSFVHSLLILAFAASNLLGRALIALRQPSRQQGMTPIGKILKFFTLPGTWTEIKFMGAVAFRHQGTLDKLDLIMLKKLEALMSLEGKNFVNMKVENLLFGLEILQADHAGFSAFINALERNFVLRFFRRLLSYFGLSATIESLYPYLFVLYNSGDTLQKSLYYSAPSDYLLSRFERLTADKNLDVQTDSGITPEMKMNLELLLALQDPNTKAKILAEYEAYRQESTRLSKDPLTNQKRLQALNSLRDDYKFAINFNRIIDRLAQVNSPRNNEMVLRMMLRELTRWDKSVGYRKDVIALIGLLDPYNQQSVQVPLEDGTIHYTELPSLLLNTKYRDLFLKVFSGIRDEKNKELMPFRRRITSVQTAA